MINFDKGTVWRRRIFCGFFLLVIMLNGCTSKATLSVSPLDPVSTHTRIALPSAMPTRTSSPPPEPTATPACEEISGALEATNYEGVVTTEEIQVLVHLPPCYEIYDHQYPVLYVLHGYPLDENHWLDLGIIETVDQGYNTGLWSHFLIVLPQIPEGLNVRTDGGEGSYEQEFIEGLVPFITENYRTRQGTGSTALAGVSRGGVWALEIGLRNANLIGTVAALSPALHVNHPRPAYDPFVIVREGIDLPDRLFLSAGLEEDGFYVRTVEFVRLLDTLEIPHTYIETSGAHENSTWIGLMIELVTFLTAEW